MPRRMITSEIWLNEKFAILPDGGRLLFIGIFSNADDDGRLKASPVYLKALIFPYDQDRTIEQVVGWRDLCKEQGLIRVYSLNGKEYLDLPGWLKHQSIRKDTYHPSKLPAYDECQNSPQPRDEAVTKPLQPRDEAVTKPKRSIDKVSIDKTSIDKMEDKSLLTPLGKGLREVWDGLNKRREYSSPNRGKEAVAIKWMIGEGYTPDQILETYDKLKKDPFWVKIPHLDMQSVKKQIGAMAKGGKGRGHSQAAKGTGSLGESIGKPLR